MKILLTLLFTAFSTIGFIQTCFATEKINGGGGTDVGSGGFAVVRGSSNTKDLSVQLYDFWEWTARLSTHIDMGQGPTHAEHIFFVLKRLETFDSHLARRLKSKAEKLLPKIESSLMDKVQFADPKDYNNLLDPPHPYRREPFALFVAWPGPGELKFMFRKELWAKADPKVKAGIILHELLYDEAVKEGEKTSDSTRRFNALICSELMNKLTAEQYFQHKFRNELLYFDRAEFHLNAFAREWRGILKTISDPKTLTITMSGALRSLVIIMAQPTANPNIFVNLRDLSDSLIFTYSEGLYAPLFIFQLVDQKMTSIPDCHPSRCPSIGEYLMKNKMWLTHEHWDKAVDYILKTVSFAKTRFIAHKRETLNQMSYHGNFRETKSFARQ